MCNLCGLAIAGSVCGNCGWRSQPFNRLCPQCGKGVPPMADHCNHCNKDIPLAVGRGLRHITCGECRRDRQVDDWFAERNNPLPFATPRGEKIRSFKNFEAAVERRFSTFNPYGWSRERCAAELRRSDSQPWRFGNTAAALKYLRAFACPQCGSRDWELSQFGVATARAMKSYAPTVFGWLAVAAAKVWVGVRWWFRTANKQFQASVAPPKPQSKGGNEKGGKR